MNFTAELAGYGRLVPLGAPVPESAPRLTARRAAGPARVLPSLGDALAEAGARDGQTFSFHHHLRNGDGVLNAVMAAGAGAGLQGLTLAPSSLFPVHAPLVEHMGAGRVAGLRTAYMTGPVAMAVGQGALPTPAVFQTHGGRARVIENGEMPVDIAFIAAAMADHAGNLTGACGPQAFGPLGYGVVDARHARVVVAVTDCLVDSLPCAPDIYGTLVDFIVPLTRIGDAARIQSGTTQITTDPTGLKIAALSADLIAASGLMRDGMSFQTGAGGISLAVARELGDRMQRANLRGGFASGGITAPLVDLHWRGLFRELLDVQAFDLAAVQSYRDDPAHHMMSASRYASPARPDAVVDALDVVILGAAEVDLSFNVNVTTGSDGHILGGSGGHADCAAGAKLTIITTALAAKTRAKIVPQARCITTPGGSVDAVVTEAGIAINPARSDLADHARAAGLPVLAIEDLAAMVPPPVAADKSGRVIGVSQYRDGRVSDLLYLPDPRPISLA